MATFGDFPGVRITTSGGGISAVRIGAEEKLLIFGDADLTEGDATPAEAVQVSSRRSVNDAFGAGSELADAIIDAFGNGANTSFTYGVALPAEEDMGEEEPSPLEAAFSVQRGDDDTDWEFLGEDEEIDRAPKDQVNEGETGVFAVLTKDAADVSTLENEVGTLRGDYIMVKGFVANPPNDGDKYAFDDITAESNSDAMYEFAPVDQRWDTDAERYPTVMGAVSGLFAGNDITQPVYNSALSGVGEMRQVVSRADANDIRDGRVIPVKENGTIRVADNLSTSEEEDWQRDFWRRRIVDRVILIAKGVGDAILGRINDERTRRATERQIETQLRGLQRDRLLTEDWFVEVTQDEADPDKVNIDLGITPQGIVKRVDVDIVIDT